jgi:hypothetical protein
MLHLYHTSNEIHLKTAIAKLKFFVLQPMRRYAALRLKANRVAELPSALLLRINLRIEQVLNHSQ